MTLELVPAVLEDVLAFAAAVGVQLYDWQRDAFGAACRRQAGRFLHRLAGVSVPRGNGKSYAGAVVGLWRLLCGPAPQDIISAALDLDGARVVLDHARSIIRRHPVLAGAIEVQATGLLVPATGSRWTITSREHTASRGRHPTLVLYDECGWVKDDELFASLLAGQASVDDPLCLVNSTVGRRQSGPLWTVKTLAEGGDESVVWWHSSENLSPKVTQQFLERQRRILVPAQFAREHQNSWVDQADSFTGAAEVDAAMGRGWTEQREGRPGVRYVGFADLGMVHDPSVICVGHLEDGVAYVDRLLTFQGSREEPVQIATIEAALEDLATRFALTQIRVESWQGIGAVQSLQRAGLNVELYTPTAKTNAEEWPILAQRLAARTIALPPHARLREELLNLVVDLGPTGVKVIDRGQVHQDHAVAVRGVVAMLLGGPSVALERCVVAGRTALPPAPGAHYVLFVSPGDGLREPAAAAVAHAAERHGQLVVVLDGLHVRETPFRPDDCAQEVIALARAHRCSHVVMHGQVDRFLRAPLVSAGLGCAMRGTPPEAELVRAFVPLVASGTVELLDHALLLEELAAVVRQGSPAGPLAGAAIGALVTAYRRGLWPDGQQRRDVIRRAETPAGDVLRRSAGYMDRIAWPRSVFDDSQVTPLAR